MPNVKISQATDIGPLQSSDMVPVARSGDTNAYHGTLAEIASYASVSVSSGAYGNVGRNLVTNGTFVVQQRGAGPWTQNGNYLADRWQQWTAGASTINTVVNPQTDAGRTQIGNEASSYVLYSTFTGGSGATDVALVQQGIENVRRLSGKTVTISFWAASNTATPKLGVSIDQNFGTGGSPSAYVSGTGQAVTVSTTYTRYSLTFTLASAAGKTLGTNGDDRSILNFWFNAGSNNAGFAGGVGAQSNGIALWGVQLEIGSAMTPLDQGGSPQQQLAECQRFYQLLGVDWGGFVTAANGYRAGAAMPVTMRAQPTATLITNNTSNLSGVAAYANQASGSAGISGTAVATAFAAITGVVGLSADL